MSIVEYVTKEGIRIVDCISDKYLLLAYFLEDFRGSYELNEIILELEKIRDGVYDYETELKWKAITIGPGIGSLDFFETASKGTIYLEADEDDTQHDSFDIDIQDVIDYLYEWKAYLGY